MKEGRSNKNENRKSHWVVATVIFLICVATLIFFTNQEDGTEKKDKSFFRHNQQIERKVPLSVRAKVKNLYEVENYKDLHNLFPF